MKSPDAPPPPAPCPFMAALVDLLGEMPTVADRIRTEAFTVRLDALESDARRHGAPEATMGALKGARVVLGLAGMPQPPRPDDPSRAR